MADLHNLSDDAFSKLVITDDTNFTAALNFIRHLGGSKNVDAVLSFAKLLSHSFPDVDIDLGVSPAKLVDKYPDAANAGILDAGTADYTFLPAPADKVIIAVINSSNSPDNIATLTKRMQYVDHASLDDIFSVRFSKHYTGELDGNDIIRRIRRR